MARLVKANNVVLDVFPRDGKSFKLDELQGFVGGYIEFVRLDRAKHFGMKGMVMCLNEEGKLNGLLENNAATLLAEGCLMDGDYIAGDAVIMTRAEAGEDE